MDAKRNAVTKLLESFPLTGGNYAVLISSFEERLIPHSIEAINLAVDRFRDGDVPGQQKRFAPTLPEFIEEVRRCEEFISLRDRPRLPAPKYIPGKLAPFQMRTQKAYADNAHLPVLFEDINYDQWRKLSAARQIPPGAKWVACLNVVFGPPAKQQQSQAA